MKKQAVATLYYITSFVFYIVAIINFTSKSGMGVMWLCLGSAFLCLGSAMQSMASKEKKTDKEKPDETRNREEDDK